MQGVWRKMTELDAVKRDFIAYPSADLARDFITTAQRYGLKLPKTLGGVKKYFRRKNIIRYYIESMNYGDPCKLAYQIALECKSDRLWAEKIIENSPLGNRARSAYLMFLNCKSEREWAEKIIESASINNPTTERPFIYAYCLFVLHGSSAKWYNQITPKSL